MDQTFVIVGGGPVGLFQAYKILSKATGVKVIVFEYRKNFRPQTLYPSFFLAKDLPAEVKDDIFNELDQATFFKPVASKSVLPSPDYGDIPFLSIGNFLISMTNFLNSKYSTRFFLVDHQVTFQSQKVTAGEMMEGNCDIVNALDIAKKAHPNLDVTVDDLTAIIYAGGSGVLKIRSLELEKGKAYESQGDGVYLTFCQDFRENYIRSSGKIKLTEPDDCGIHYLASNDLDGRVQVYTYPRSPSGKLLTALTPIYDRMPEQFKILAKFSSLQTAIKLNGEGLDQADETVKAWFATYRKTLLKELERLEIPLPSDHSTVCVYFAERGEYFFRQVSQRIACGNQVLLPIFYIGDAAGCTDYWRGQSFSRGVLSAQELSKLLFQNVQNAYASSKKNLSDVMILFQSYWNKVISQEFNKTHETCWQPAVMYKYRILGRKVILNDEQKTLVEFDESKESFDRYLKEVEILSRT
eukprot:Awhi_evm1s14219